MTSEHYFPQSQPGFPPIRIDEELERMARERDRIWRSALMGRMLRRAENIMGATAVWVGGLGSLTQPLGPGLFVYAFFVAYGAGIVAYNTMAGMREGDRQAAEYEKEFHARITRIQDEYDAAPVAEAVIPDKTPAPAQEPVFEDRHARDKLIRDAVVHGIRR